MPDRGKLIDAMTLCANGELCVLRGKYHTCPYSPLGKPESYDCCTAVIADALELIREQEPQETRLEETRLVRHYSRPGVYADLWLHCEKCGGKIDDRYKSKHCPDCGRKVKWDEAD